VSKNLKSRNTNVNEILYEVIPNPLVTFDKNLMFVNCNQQFLDTLGFSKDELVGLHVHDFLTEEDQQLTADIMEQLSICNSILNQEFHVKRKDGSIFHSIWNIMQSYDDENGSVGFTSIGLDLTEIDKLQDKLVKQEKMSALLELKNIRNENIEQILYEVIPSPVITFDQNNKAVDCNQYFLDKMGFSKDEVMDMSATDFLTEKDQKTYREVIEPSLNQKLLLKDIDLYIRKKDGSFFHSIWNHIRISGTNDEYLGFTAIGLDLTEIDKLQDELVKKEKWETLGKLSAHLAHDMRNPLSVIQMSLENMRLLFNPNEQKSSQMKKIEHAINRITHQVDGVLDFVLEKPLTLKKINMSKIIDECLGSIVIPSHVELILPKSNIEVVCDEVKLSTALYNIILNSIQSISDSGTIEISTNETNNEIIIQIQDSGEGISKEEIDNIFDPLFTTKQNGTGLGLASVKSIIKSHGGTISVTSPPTIFTITLPKTLNKN